HTNTATTEISTLSLHDALPICMNTAPPTPYPKVNAMLKELLPSVQTILGEHFIGMYLDGSLTGSDFDEASDIDFLVVSDIDISRSEGTRLNSSHDQISYAVFCL